jgi:hypothetical protein
LHEFGRPKKEIEMTQEDTLLLNCLPEKVKQFKDSIYVGRPYVWELRLSLEDFYALESAISNSISSHSGEYRHLLHEEFAVIVVMYLAEWFKRFYKGADTMDENKVLALNTDELKTLYKLAGIDTQVFVYNGSKNPDKTSYRWLESLQVLGGLAVQAELKRDQNDALLPQLCKIFHGEELDLDNLNDRNRAVAFHESIVRQHSLYEYLDCILNPDKEMPFAKSDMSNSDTLIPELIQRIKSADELAKKDKFDFEWIIAYNGAHNRMVRHLRIRLKPEVIGGGKKQYIGYDRLRSREWGIEHPEDIGRIRLYLRFKNGGYTVKKEDANEEPIFKYDNTGSAITGFLSVNKMDENTYTDIPVSRFDKVEMVMKYDVPDKQGAMHTECHIVQRVEVKEYLQVYAMPRTSNKFSSRRNSQAATAVIFSSSYHLTDPYKELPVVYAHFRNGEACSEDYCWCPINDMVVIANSDGKEVQPPFFNRNGLYQVVTKKYLKTIKYKDNLFVLYRYTDADYDEQEMQEDNLPVLFGRSGLEVRHYPNGQAKEGNLISDYDLEWLKNGRYVDWKAEEPQQGELRLRVTVKGLVFKPRVYYVPFEPTAEDNAPIWRDFEHKKICTALNGVADIQDVFNPELFPNEPITKQLEIGSTDAKILVDVYRPLILRELTQITPSEKRNRVEYYSKDDTVKIPLINCQQFSIRDFSEEGVQDYQLKSCNNAYYSFPTFDQLGFDTKRTYTLEESAVELLPNVPLEYLKIYITKLSDTASNLYKWDYRNEPQQVASAKELTEAGIVFQSLKDDEYPRDYVCPTIKTNDSDDWDDDDDWGDESDDESTEEINVFKCFEVAAEHKTYFFLFEPLVKCISTRSQIKEIVLPLIKARKYKLTDVDRTNLYTFALHFHFDWMLLPREQWIAEIDAAANDESEKEKLTDAVIDLFSKTPKCTDEREHNNLKKFIKKYWTFNAYPKIDEVGEVALRLILNEPDALGKFNDLKDYLKVYDDCRYKFIEMDKAIINEN